MTDAFIDPVTRGYVIASGSVQRDPANGLANAVYLRLETPLGSYWGDPTLGSRLYLLQREKDLPQVALLARQYAEEALQPLIKSGRAQSITVTATQPGNGRLLLEILVVDGYGQQLTFKHPVKVM